MGDFSNASQDETRKAVIDHIIKNSLFRDSRIVRRFKGAVSRSLGEETTRNQTKTSWEIIYFLCGVHFSDTTCTVSDIFLSIGVSKTSVIRCVSRLEQMDIVEKTVDTKDSRRRMVALSKVFAPIVIQFVDECMELFGDLIEVGQRKERSRAEAILRANEQRFRDIADSSSDWFWETDDNFHFTYFSQRTDELYEFHFGEMEGKTLWEAIGADPENSELWAKHLTGLLAGDPFRNFQISFDDPSGQSLTISFSGRPFYNDDGVFQGYRGAASDLTEAARTQAALKESEDRFAEFAYLSSDWIWEMGADFRYTWISDDHWHKSPFTPGLQIGNSVYEIALSETREDRRVLAAHVKDLDAHRPFRDFEHRRRAADGSIIWVSVNGAPIFGDNNEFLGYRGSTCDITKRKRAEIERARIEAQFEEYAHLASDWFWEMDTDFRYIWISLERELVTGELPESVLGKARWDCALIENEEDQRLMDAHRVEVEAHLPYRNFEYKKPGQNGAVHWYTVSATPYYDTEGNFAGYRGTARDVDERKKAEQELQDRTRLFSSIIENIPYSVFWKDSRGTFQGCNTNFSAIVGIKDAASISGMVIEDLSWTQNEAEAFCRNDWEVLQGGKTLLYRDVIFTRSDGSVRVLQVSKMPLRNNQGEITGLLGVCTEVNSRKH
ncbi:MAG: PAS domain S-box protein [Gimesia sp.]